MLTFASNVRIYLHARPTDIVTTAVHAARYCARRAVFASCKPRVFPLATWTTKRSRAVAELCVGCRVS
jgi:hypothetical protein